MSLFVLPTSETDSERNYECIFSLRKRLSASLDSSPCFVVLLIKQLSSDTAAVSVPRLLQSVEINSGPS